MHKSTYMPKIFILLPMTLIPVNYDLHKFLANFALSFHQFCTDQVSTNESLSPIFTALTCGKKIRAGALFENFRNWGLLHLMVVSGAHLALVEKILVQLRFVRQLHTLFLVFFCLASGAQAPVLRALSFYIGYQWNKKFKLNTSPFQCAVIMGLVCLVIFPRWLFSFSFLMSWLASLLIHSCRGSLFRTCSTLYLGLLPATLFLGFPQPLSILINWAFTPFFGGVLFPLTLLSSFSSFIYGMTHWLWEQSLILLHTLPVGPAVRINEPPSPFLLWVYIAFLIGVLWSKK